METIGLATIRLGDDKALATVRAGDHKVLRR
jgi:hypothetical protein